MNTSSSSVAWLHASSKLAGSVGSHVIVTGSISRPLMPPCSFHSSNVFVQREAR
jgi:hypothetical protein